MAKSYSRARRPSASGRQLSINDPEESKQIKQQTPVKVLVFTGKCSDVFKSTLEDCVEDCLLEFPGENSVYVTKRGQGVQLPMGTKSDTILLSKAIHASGSAATRSLHRGSSQSQANSVQGGSIRTNQSSGFSLPTMTMAATSATRMRHQTVAHRLRHADSVSEETTDIHTPTEQAATITGVDLESEHPILGPEESVSHPSSYEVSSQSTAHPRSKLLSTSTHRSMLQRQKDYRLSDLVMFGPEYFAHIFHLPRPSRSTTQAAVRQRSRSEHPPNPVEDKYHEFDRIKQDLFHRYLWTQKPQVSCRIRPSPSHSRSSTYVM